MMPVLDVSDLRVAFPGVDAVRGISLRVERGQTHCVVGESGCGKSVTSLAIMGLLKSNASRSAEYVRLGGEDILRLPERRMRALRGSRLAMIFQEPMTSLNPAYTIGSQMTEVYRRHRGASRRDAVERATALLGRVGVSAADMRLGQYPHELSGGLRQRVMIAMALMCEPDLLIADEPTTALDVTVQAQILSLLCSLQKDSGLAILFITHDLGIVARMADRVSVMYAGEIVESGPASAIFSRPMHPYTRGLLACIPVPGRRKRREPLPSIPGVVPRITPGFAGCGFRDRCALASAACDDGIPEQAAEVDHHYRCQLVPQDAARSVS